MGAGIQLIGVSKAYKEKEVVKSVYLDIAPGAFLTILGPSGAGKTTVLKMIAGFERTSDGYIKIDGKDITDTPSYKRNIGMLFQNYALFPHLSVRDNVAFPLTIRKESTKEIERKTGAILEKVKLTGYEKRLPRELSGGQQQRVALARALVFNPPILLLDEPMSALDKQLRKHMQIEIKEIQREIGITTVSVTHDQEEALTMASQVCVMKDGAVAQTADPEEIYEKPRSAFIANFIGEANLLKGRVESIQGDEAVVALDSGPRVPISTGGIFYIPGERVLALVRPEKIRPAEGETSDAVRLEGTVRKTIYVGEALRLELAIPSGETVKVKVLSKRSAAFSVGSKISIAVRSEDFVLVKEDSPA